MAKLEIWFDHDPELGVAKVAFDDGDGGGGTMDRYSDNPPPATRGFMAHMCLFVNAKTTNPPWFPVKDWPASSVDELARREVAWRKNLFGKTWVEDLLPRKQRDKKAYRCLNESILHATNIHISLDGLRVTNSARLQELTKRIADRCNRIRLARQPQTAASRSLSIAKIPWTPKGVRLGLACGLLEERNGVIDISTRFLDVLSRESREWELEKLPALAQDGWQEFLIVSSLKAKERREKVHEDDFAYLLNELALPLANYLMSQCARLGLVTDYSDDAMILEQSFVNEFYEMSYLIGDEEDVREFVLRAYLQLVKARLICRHAELFSQSALLACFLYRGFGGTHVRQLEIALKEFRGGPRGPNKGSRQSG